MTKRGLTFEEMKKPWRALIDRRRLHEIVPLSERTVFDMKQRGEFPKRFVLTTRRIAWDLAEVEQWMEDCRSAGKQATMPGTKTPEN